MSQAFDNRFAKNEPKNSSIYTKVQFQTTLQFDVNTKTAFETSSLLHFINHLLELPGFEFDEIENKLNYRYVLLSTRPSEAPYLYISILGIIMMVLDMFEETIEKVATGEMTFNEILKQIINVSNEIP